MPSQDRKNEVDQYGQKQTASNEGALDIGQRLSGLDVGQRLSGLDYAQRKGSIEIDNKLTSVPMLSIKDFGHSAKYIGDQGSILSATNAKTLDSFGVISATTKLDIGNAETVAIENSTFVKQPMSWLHYAFVKDDFLTMEDARAGMSGNASLLIDGNILTALGLSTINYIDLPIVIPMCIQDNGLTDSSRRFTRIIGPFIIPLHNNSSAETVYNENGVFAGVNTTLAALDVITGYKSNIWKLRLDNGDECLNIIKIEIEYDINDWDKIEAVIDWAASASYDISTYTIDFYSGGSSHSTNEVDIGRARVLSITLKYIKGSTTTTRTVRLAGEFDSEAFQYEDIGWGNELQFPHDTEYYGTRGITGLGVDISSSEHPADIKLTVTATCNFSQGGGDDHVTLESYSGSDTFTGGKLSQDDSYYFKSGTAESTTVNDCCFEDLTVFNVRRYNSGVNIIVNTKLISQASHKTDTEESYNAVYIGKMSGGVLLPMSICKPVESITSISKIRSTVNFDICVASNNTSTYLCVYDKALSKLRYVNIIGYGGTTSLFFKNKSIIVDKINVVSEEESSIGFYVSYLDGTEYYFHYDIMSNNDGGKLFQDDLYNSNTWCTGYQLSSFNKCIEINDPVNSCNNGVEKAFTIISSNDDVAFLSNDISSIKCLSGEPQIYSVNDYLPDSIGVINDSIKLSLSTIKILHTFSFPSVPFNINSANSTTQTTPRGIIGSVSGISRDIKQYKHSVCIVNSPPLDNDTKEYSILPPELSTITGIENNKFTRPLSFNGILGKTSVVVGKNVYEQSKYRLIRKNGTAILPESGYITIYGGLAFVSDNNTSTIYSQSELGFQYLTSIKDVVLSNIVNISGSIVFAGAKALYALTDGIISKLLDIQSVEAQIRSINGSDFTLISSNDSDTQFIATDGTPFEGSNGILYASYIGTKFYQIEQNLSVSEIVTDDVLYDNYFIVKSDNVINEEMLLINEYYNAKQIYTTDKLGYMLLTTRNISIQSQDLHGFMCEAVEIRAFVDYDSTLELPIDAYSDYILFSLSGGESNEIGNQRIFITETNSKHAERIYIPVGQILREFRISLSCYPTIKIVGINLIGKYMTELK